MPLRLDMHVHSWSRGRECMTAGELAEGLKARGIDGAAITNFHDVAHARGLARELPECVIIVGQEMLTRDGHVTGLGLRERIDDFLSAAETIERIHAQGGVAVAVHPFLHLGVRDLVFSLPFDAIESFNAFAASFFVFDGRNRRAAAAARALRLTALAGSDTTSPRHVGTSWTEIDVPDGTSPVDALRLGAVSRRERRLPHPYAFFLRGLYRRNLPPLETHEVACFLCGHAQVVSLWRRRHTCLDCGRVERARIACCNGHYLCHPCFIRRDIDLSSRRPPASPPSADSPTT